MTLSDCMFYYIFFVCLYTSYSILYPCFYLKLFVPDDDAIRLHVLLHILLTSCYILLTTYYMLVFTYMLYACFYSYRSGSIYTCYYILLTICIYRSIQKYIYFLLYNKYREVYILLTIYFLLHTLSLFLFVPDDDAIRLRPGA